jgi:hypothetical protein
MLAGQHCANFVMRLGHSLVGVVGAGFDTTTNPNAGSSTEAWMLDPSNGMLCHASGDNSRPNQIEWVGKAEVDQLKAARVIVRLPH